MGLFRYILGGEARRSLAKLHRMADKVLSLEEKYAKFTDEELRDCTEHFKGRLKAGETLDDILCDAFAVVREAAFRVLNMRHYKVQIIGGICLHQGRVAEMKTGEGKTLVATLPAYLNALAGEGVHIVTVNDYLAARDAEWMGKVYKFLGLTVGVAVSGMEDEDKKKAYACDITYGTNNEMGFDYLRDNLKSKLDQMVQRPLSFAIVDEVDSILIDEARTPLIISGKGQESSDKYITANKFVKSLVLDKDFTIDIKEKSVQITESGAEKAEAFFGLNNFADIENASLSHHIQQALKANYIFKRDNDYVVSDGEVIIVDEFTGRLMIGRRYSDGLHQAIEAKESVKIRNENKTYATITFQNYFRLYKKLSGMTGTAKSEEEEFRSIYGLDVLEIPTNKPVARIDMPDIIYKTVAGKNKAIVKEIVERHKKGQPVLVGTVTVEKSEEISKLLIRQGVKHNVLNAKNHAREADIVAQAGRLGAVTIATNMAGRGTDILLGGNPEFIAKRKLREEGVADDVIELATSFISNIPEDVQEVRERYHRIYAEIKAQTDEEKIKVVEAGGLHILGTERHESRRIDNQLRGRSGRQGDAGSSVFFISLEDDLAKRFGGERMQRIYEFFNIDEDQPMQSKMLSRSIENAQRTIEGKNFGIRKHVLEYDDVMNKQREVMYAERMKVIKDENVHEDILKLIPDFVRYVVSSAIDNENKPDTWDLDALNSAIEMKLLPKGSEFATKERSQNWDYEYFIEQLIKETIEVYDAKIERYKEEGVNFSEIERVVLLKNIDTKWIDHIDSMDQLRKGISLRSYGQVDPVLEYKKEGFEMFEDLTAAIQDDTVTLLLKAELQKVRPVEKQEQENLQTNRPMGPVMKKKVVHEIGRNDPCPCGSGKKYKNCCGAK
ncbi:MAG: preprotein translocase subunit SecA [Clostridiales bacterium]|nr:preprotein translocase subunit SecA [Clostridiales bacterium]MBQ3047319.1 preprotein translocase subunit SecA [Clostridia bacterium]